MRSVTSCFNSTLYTKTMGRFWPLWTLYGVIWMFAIPLRLLTRYFNYARSDGETVRADRLLELALETPNALMLGVGLSCVFAILSAMAVFGYLYNSRASCMMHALPLRRESLFSTNYLAGLSFLLLPQLAAAALAAAAELALLPSAGWGAALSALGTWLLAQSAVSLFFFSFAAFCAMFTGHILALPAFYGILNILVAGVTALVTGLMSQFFYGYTEVFIDGPLVEYCTPVYALTTACRWTGPLTETALGQSAAYAAAETGSALAAPGTVAAYAAAGVVFFLLALLVYRRRHVESAGDVVAIALVRPIFRYGVAVCSGLAFGVGTAFFFGWNDQPLPLTLCVLLWAAVGYFAAEMLLKKSFRVFKAWKGCAAVVAVMLLLCCACIFDLFGVVTRVPQTAGVSSVSVSMDLRYPYDCGSGNWQNITDPAQIEKFITLHQAIVDGRDSTDRDEDGYIDGDSSTYFSVDYTLNNGSRLRRRYNDVPLLRTEQEKTGSATYAVRQILDDRTLVELAYGLRDLEGARPVEALLSGVSYQNGSENWNEQWLDGAAGEDIDGLWAAVQQDFADGTLGVRYLFDDAQQQANTFQTNLNITFAPEFGSAAGRPIYRDFSVILTPNAAHTLAWLEEMSALGVSYWLVTQDGDVFPGATPSA